MANPEFLEQRTGMRERAAYAREALSAMTAANADWWYDSLFSAHERVERYASNAAHGLWVVPDNTIIVPDARLKFSWKRGPFVEYLSGKDLREAQPRMVDLKWPATAKLGERADIPAQTVGVRFGAQGFTRYSASLLDLLGSQLTYNSLRNEAKILKDKEGVLQVQYASSILLTIYGLRRNMDGEISATLTGFPSRTDEKLIHDPTYRLEVVRHEPPPGLFSVTSGYQQHGTRNLHVWINYNGNLDNKTPKKSRASTVDRVALSLGDIVGLRMIETIARKQYGVELNQPIPRFPDAMVRLAQHIGDRAVLVSLHGERRKPDKTEWNMLLGTALASSQREVLLRRAQENV